MAHEEGTTQPADAGPVERTVGRPVPERDPRDMTTAELQAAIGRLQRELIRRVCGDPVRGIGLTIGGPKP